MTSSPRSSSDPPRASAVEQLAEPVRRWIYKQGWTRLRDVQEKAIPHVLAGGDVVISARTAAGKTEAALLPLLTRLVRLREAGSDKDGFGLVYASPLKALINDQYRRLESLCEECEIALHRWHGDVSQSEKRRARDRPSGVVLITPESLEATLVRRGRDTRSLFSNAQAFVVDELHAFIGSERGMQLQSILSRIEIACGRPAIDRIGLSATLGDMRLAAAALRARAERPAKIVEGADVGAELKLLIKGYTLPRHEPNEDNEGRGEGDAPIVPPPVADDLHKALRGRYNLLFAGSRARVEIYADALRTLCEARNLPNEFFAHHGSLSKDHRESVELRLREGSRPTTAVATTTLELGIDIGDVETIAQIESGCSVASMRQRLGRSGRRPGKPAVMRIFVLEQEDIAGDHPIQRLKLRLVQGIAMVELMLEGWCEPPAPLGLHLSTLIHQTLAAILQTGGLTAAAAYRLLCERGAFQTVDKALFVDLLRSMAAPEHRLIEQKANGLLMIGENGERITEAHDFYAVFETPEEYRVIHDGRVLGVYPLSIAVAPGQALIFAGRRWRIDSIDDDAKAIFVNPHRTKRPPKFDGDYGGVHDRIAERMKDVLANDRVPTFLDDSARRMLAQARDAFRSLQLGSCGVVEHGGGSILLPWTGTKKLVSLALALNALEVEASPVGHTIELPHTNVGAALSLLARIASEPAPPPSAIASRMAKPQRAKFDRYLTPDLMMLAAVVEQLDIPAIPTEARRIVDLGGR